jgi:hypothetical protein
MADSSPPPRPDPPPLRIHHLLACAAVAAFLLTVWRSQMRPENWKLVDSASPATLVLFAINQIIHAAAITLVVFSVYWHVKGYAALKQPGQWLPFATSLAAFRTLAMPLIGRIVIESPWRKNVFLWDGSDLLAAVVYFLAVFPHWVLPILLFGWLAWRIADTLPWRILFSLKAFGAALLFLPDLLFQYFGFSGGAASTLLATIASVAMLVCAVWAPAHDYVRGTRRTWTHWTGIGLFLAQYVVGTIMFGFHYLKLL